MENADNRIRLLLVEDERTLAGIIADTLSEKGFEVRCAYNGADGLRAAADFRPEVVVTDIMMPTMDGFTFVKRLRQEGICGENVPVLFLSARSGAEDVVRGFELGAQDYIRKPFAMSELIVRIHALLQGGSSAEPLPYCPGTVHLRPFHRRPEPERRQQHRPARPGSGTPRPARLPSRRDRFQHPHPQAALG